jgi:hypothetical protein
MGIFRINVKPDELERLEQQIEDRVRERKKQHGDYVEKENELAAPVVNYSDVEMEDISYELFKAREYVKMFPEEDFFAPRRSSGFKRFYQRVVRRVLRQQIVFNQFMLGAVEDLNCRIVKIEQKLKSLGSKEDKLDTENGDN